MKGKRAQISAGAVQVYPGTACWASLSMLPELCPVSSCAALKAATLMAHLEGVKGFLLILNCFLKNENTFSEVNHNSPTAH